MILPEFLLRKLYRRGSLRETGDGRFAFTLQNPLRLATLVAPPRIVVNGIAYPPSKVALDHLDLGGISREAPFHFRKGDVLDLHMPGYLLRGGNRIHMTVQTAEFGEVDILIEDKEAASCDLPDAAAEAGTAA